MRVTNPTKNKIDTSLTSIDAIDKVNVSPFFKDKTMRLLFAEKEQTETIVWSWFTPKLQLVTLCCFVFLNALAYINLEANTNNDNDINDFAKTYGFSDNSQDSFLN